METSFIPGNDIPLIAADFDRLDRDSTDQYVNPWGCPIFKALKRLGADVGSVDPFIYELSDHDDYFRINGEYGEVERCRKELLAGAEVAYIKAVKS